MFALSEGADRHGNISKCPLPFTHAEELGAIQGGSFLAIDPTAGSQQKEIRIISSHTLSCALIQGKPCSSSKYTTRIIMDTHGMNG